MAGKRHHFIPRFLQRGFAIDEGARTQRIWVYKKNHPTYAANIINSGVEGYFYGLDSDNALDDEITKLEDKYAAIINSARTIPINTRLDKKSISKLIYNFEIRTRNLRESFRESVELVVQEVVNKLSDPEEYKKLLNQMIDEELNNLVNKECENQGIPRSMAPLYRAKFKSASQPLLEAQLPQLHLEMKSQCDKFKSLISDTLTSNIKKAHIQAMLKASEIVTPKLKWYEKLEYSIYEASEEEIPLGDSIILFHVSGDRKYKNFLDNKNNLLAVILPISPRRIVYGTKRKDYVPDITAIKQAIISSSKEFFLFSRYTKSLEDLKVTISTNSHIVNDEEMKNIVFD